MAGLQAAASHDGRRSVFLYTVQPQVAPFSPAACCGWGQLSVIASISARGPCSVYPAVPRYAKQAMECSLAALSAIANVGR